MGTGKSWKGLPEKRSVQSRGWGLEPSVRALFQVKFFAVHTKRGLYSLYAWCLQQSTFNQQPECVPIFVMCFQFTLSSKMASAKSQEEERDIVEEQFNSIETIFNIKKCVLENEAFVHN
jgi:hypothetical protein